MHSLSIAAARTNLPRSTAMLIIRQKTSASKAFGLTLIENFELGSLVGAR